MKFRFCIVVLICMASSAAPAQVVAAHSSTAPKGATAPKAAVPSPSLLVSGKPVARVNGSVLTDRDLLRQMFAIFPYARLHNGFPRSMEAEIRQGALEMIIFEELVYQDALRRKVTIPPAHLDRAEADFRNQFSSQQEFDAYLKSELKGSRQLLRKKVARSLLIESVLKTELSQKSKVSLLEAKVYYDNNPKLFQHAESFAIQTISILPPDGASPAVQQQARKRAEEALRQAKATKSYEEFGLLAEKISEDDYRVNMGDHHAVARDKLPPEIVKTALAMKPGQVSGMLRLGTYYTLFRLNAHTPAGSAKFEEVKDQLRKNLEKEKYNQLRTALHKRLREKAKVEVL